MNSVTKYDVIMKRLNYSERDLLQYALGGLMYTPAHNQTIAGKLISKKNKYLHAMVFCLEDAIADGTEEAALRQLSCSFDQLGKAVSDKTVQPNDLPYLFVRVKYPKQMRKVYELIGHHGLLKGFVFPKFDCENSNDYLSELQYANSISDRKLYGMPILESGNIISIENRISQLVSIKEALDDSKNTILNVRIGGNDFCNAFGIRRGINNTIYDVRVISDIISDIVNVFAREYVVSAPVWEYFASKDDTSDLWAQGLKREAEYDILNGLIGKTAIHPTQLPIIDEALAVSADDYNDSINILNWNNDLLAVSKSHSGNRMNEQKVHNNWAKKIIMRSAIYGIKEECREKKFERATMKIKDHS